MLPGIRNHSTVVERAEEAANEGIIGTMLKLAQALFSACANFSTSLQDFP